MVVNKDFFQFIQCLKLMFLSISDSVMMLKNIYFTHWIN